MCFKRDEAVVRNEKRQVLLRAERKGNLYFIKEGETVCKADVTQEGKLNSGLRIWHEIMGHVNVATLKQMQREGVVEEMRFDVRGDLSKCEVCAKEKITQLPFKSTGGERTKDILEIIHTDICGPLRVPSVSGARYIIVFIDDKSRWCTVDFLKTKDECLKSFKAFKSRVETETGKKIKFLQSDNGKEFCNGNFDMYLKENGIQRRLTTPYTPQQNGVAERMNRTLMEMSRCLMRQNNVPARFWAEAVSTSCYVRNRCSSKSLQGVTPFEIWNGRKPSLGHMRVFGSKVFMLDKTQKNKLNSKGLECVFMGYSLVSKAYRLWCPQKGKILVSRDVRFINTSGFEVQSDPGSKVKTDGLMKAEYQLRNSKVNFRDKTEMLETEWCDEPVSPLHLRRDKRIHSDGEPMETPRSFRDRLPSEPVRGGRGRGRPRLLRTGSRGRPRKIFSVIEGFPGDGGDGIGENEDIEEYPKSPVNPEELEEEVFAGFASFDDPVTWQEAESSPAADSWKAALEDEYSSLLYNHVWDVVECPLRQKILKNRLVFKTKVEASKEKKKIRLVVKGCSQRPGVDYSETSSPVARSTSVRLLSALSAEFSLEIHQMDVVTAYLNGFLKEEIYMEVPEHLQSFLKKIIDREPVGMKKQVLHDVKMLETASNWLESLGKCQNAVCLLKRALYGLKQSGVSWYKKLIDELGKLGLQSTGYDPCLFFSRRHESLMLITIYVDDILIASNDNNWIRELKTSLSKVFQMKDMGPVGHCLGVDFNQSDQDSSVVLTQRNYILSMLEKFKMSECKPAVTPMDSGCKLVRPEHVDTELMRNIPYQRLIGGLLYLAVTTRPDIAFATSYLSQFNSCYDESHWKAAKRVLRYLKGTSSYGLKYEKSGESLYGMVDADWAGNLVDRRSYTGYIFVLANGPVCWEARKQRTVATSSAEAEYMAISEATKESLYLRGILRVIGVKTERIILWNDSQSAQKMVKSYTVNARSKHIDIRVHFVREVYQNGVIDLEYISTEQMPADVMTKGLSSTKHYKCISRLGFIII